MVSAIKVYLNNFWIESNINSTISDEKDFTLNRLFNEKFYINYLELNISKYFKSHENNIIWENELIVRLVDLSTESPILLRDEDKKKIDEIKYNQDIYDISEPNDSWIYFIKQKFEKNNIY